RARPRAGHVPRDPLAVGPRLLPVAAARLPRDRQGVPRPRPRGVRLMRPDLTVLAGLIPDGSRVLDLGCGEGQLLAHLEQRGCEIQGVEIDGEAVVRAVRRGVPVIEADIEGELSTFADGSYDVVVLSQTLQAMVNPAQVLRELKRVGTRGVVSVPNFGLWRNRLALLRGRMPVSATIPHAWY